MSVMFTILLIVLSSRRGGDDYTHYKCEWDSQHFTGLQEALPRLPEDFRFVFWLRGLIETVRSFQLHIVYVLVLLCMHSCLG